MNAVISKWGNSPALRLPSAVLKEAGYNMAQKVELIVSEGSIIIQPSPTVEYDLDELINGIDARNTHSEFSFGDDVDPEVSKK
jgi:antitoxin MazE